MYWPSLDIITVEPVEPNMFVLCSHCLAIIFAFVECLEEISCSLHPGHDSGIQASGLSKTMVVCLWAQNPYNTNRWNMLELVGNHHFSGCFRFRIEPYSNYPV